MKLNGFHIFKAGVYITRGNWANAGDFCDYFKRDFLKISFDIEEVILKINELIKTSEPTKKVGQDEAAQILFANDLAKIKENIAKIKFKDPETELNENFEKLKNLLKDHGINYNQPLFIVDHFPKPYDFFDRNGTTGTNFDAADSKMFGLKQGIYLRRQKLNPITSSYLLSHELIHSVTGLKDCNYLARGLEEGFTQFFGEIYLSGQIFGYKAAQNHMINRRLQYPYNEQQWEQYVDWLRQGCVFYQKFGIKGIIEIIKKGRGTIKKADKLMLQGKSDMIDLLKGDFIKELDEAAQIILNFNRGMVYSPLGVYLAQNIKLNEPVDKLFYRLNIKKNEGAKAIAELNERVFSILVDKGEIAIDDTKLYLRAGSLRYETISK